MKERVLTREIVQYQDGSLWFECGMVDLEALPENDILPIPIEEPGPDGVQKYPPCPDCKGEVVWAENGRVSGSRKCVECGSCFADSRYHA